MTRKFNHRTLILHFFKKNYFQKNNLTYICYYISLVEAIIRHKKLWVTCKESPRSYTTCKNFATVNYEKEYWASSKFYFFFFKKSVQALHNFKIPRTAYDNQTVEMQINSGEDYSIITKLNLKIKFVGQKKKSLKNVKYHVLYWWNVLRSANSDFCATF